MSLIVLCDFDGTAVDINTCDFILKKFAKRNWRIFDEQLEREEITLEECLQKQFSLIRVPKTRMLEEIEQVTSVRQNFEKLVKCCRTRGLSLVLVSAGLDFVIKNFLQLKGWSGLIEVYAPKSRCTINGIKFKFPKLLDETSVNFKDDLVRYYKKQGKKVVYVGDGFPDYHPARNADFPFAIKGSKLAALLKRDGIPYKEISDFEEVVEAINASNSHK